MTNIPENPLAEFPLAQPGEDGLWHSTVNPHPELGFHADVRGGMNEITQKMGPGLLVNGQPWDYQAFKQIIPRHKQYEPVTVSHPKERMANLAAEMVAAGQSQAVIDNFLDERRKMKAEREMAQQQQPLASTREKLYMPWSFDHTKTAADFDVEQVIPAGPHTEEVEVEGEKNPVIMQHDDPEVLKDMKLFLSSEKFAFLPMLLGLGAGMLARGMVGGLVKGAIGRGIAGGIAGGATRSLLDGGGGGQAPGAPTGPAPVAPMPTEYLSSVYEELRRESAPYEHPSSIPKLNELDPEDVDPHEHNDGDHSQPIDDYDVAGEGGSSDPQGIDPDGPVGEALQSALPALLHFFNSDESGADDPTIQKLIEALETEHPGILDEEPSDDDIHNLKSLTSSVRMAEGILPVTPGNGMPGGPAQMPAPGTQQLQNPVADPQQQVNPMTQANCPQCGARVSPGTGTCPQCGGGINVGAGPVGAPTDNGMGMPMQSQSPIMGQPRMGAATPYDAHDEALRSLLARPDLQPHEQQALNVAMALRQNNMTLQNARQRARRPGEEKVAADGGPTNPEQFQMVIDAVAQQQGVTPDQLPAGQLYDIVQNPGNYADVLAQIQGQGDRPQPDPDPGVPPPMPDPSQMGMDPAAMGGGAPPPGMPMMGHTHTLESYSVHQALIEPQHPAMQGFSNCPTCGAEPSQSLGTHWVDAAGHNWPKAGPSQPQMQQFQAASDNVTPPCPNCGSHTTGMITDDGQAQCSNCNHKWKTDFDLQGTDTPVATKAAAENVWVDNTGAPLMVGQEYEMHSQQYDVPDTIRVTSVKPDALEYVLTGEYGLEHKTAVSRQEADLDGLTFISTDQPEPEDLQAAPVSNGHDFGALSKKEADFGFNLQPYSDAFSEATTGADPWGTDRGTAQGLGQCPNCGAEGSMRGNLCMACGHTIQPPAQPLPGQDAMRSVAPPGWTARLAGKKYTPMEQREFIDESGEARNKDKLQLEGTHYTDDPDLGDDFFIFGL